MHIGLIGGVGPAATEVYYRALVRAFAAANRKLALTIVHADAREMVANLEAGRAIEQAAIFAGYVDQLRASGCDAVAVTSMGGHFCMSELERVSRLPVLSAVPALNTYLAASGARRVGVLGTRAVMLSKLYGVNSVEVVIPSAEDIDAVHSSYVTLATSGNASPDQCSYFHAAARKLHENGNADAVVLGGTDLSIAFRNTVLPFPVLDSALIHVEAIAHAAMN
ncbi:aspartate/glutamate racemase family protein [Acidocella aminolytica]|uniref:Aspartate racemase n=1 Tax=Acidocella aminolytica 101 = DSM 11237 TaxID=1120923 RepID=A0A0D6PLS8_9PROT|nr:aspartate/glutamate racemase family protein [Acidocella aminolytica]GAN82183.1 aspartate racemase [Acidocella aminolytica 101 = DSM 11237]GBQ45009.1 aspartate racemase [Acidocella aminolytica 101 = DSM 11237]SHF54699.1 aspartate racemase [Acidocella aminolytica 101 = DSM 11237]